MEWMRSIHQRSQDSSKGYIFIFYSSGTAPCISIILQQPAAAVSVLATARRLQHECAAAISPLRRLERLLMAADRSTDEAERSLLVECAKVALQNVVRQTFKQLGKKIAISEWWSDRRIYV